MTIKECVESAYLEEGPVSAYDLALEYGVECRYCEHCDAETPAFDEDCSFCGQPYLIRRK